MSKKHPVSYFMVAVAFATYTSMVSMSALAGQKEAIVEVKAGTVTGIVTDLGEKPLEGKSIEVMDSSGKIKYSAITDKNGNYKMTGLESGKYTMIIAKSQKITLVVKQDATNSIVNAMLPPPTKPGASGEILGMSTPLVAAIAGGVVLVGVGAGLGLSRTGQDDSGATVHVSP